MKKALFLFSILIISLVLAKAALAIPNPASTYCEVMGYSLAGENCVFPDGSKCEEWAFYRGECGKNFVKTLACRKAGEYLEPGTQCCGGLTGLETTAYTDGKCMGAVGAWPICRACGNGVCDDGENQCNCEKDCKSQCKKEGELCGGIAGFRCCGDLYCQIDDPNIADASGTCVKDLSSEKCTKCGSECVLKDSLKNKGDCGPASQDFECQYRKEKCEKSVMPGSDRDGHGCIPSAGYTWCETKQKCLRTWEEKCDDKSGNNGDIESTLNKIKGDYKIDQVPVITRLNPQGISEVSVEKPVKVFGFFPVKMKIKLQVNFQNQEVIKTENPWWSFLVW